jgi:DNA-binding transcriptional LysR family regulator
LRERQIEVFRAVMNYGGINRASKILNISQPAVSRMISSLEADTGIALFERSGRAVKPTPEAHQLKSEVDTFFIGLDRISQAAGEIRELRRGHVRMTVMPALALSVTPAIMRQVTAKHPTIKTTLDVHTSPRIGDLIASGQFDLGIGHLAISRPEIEVLGTWRVDCVCVMACDHHLAGHQVLRPEDLDGEALVSLSYQTDTAQWLDQVFHSAGVRPRIRVEAQPSYAACLLAAAGLGITIVDALTGEFFRSDNICVVPFGPGIPFEFKLIRPSGTRPSALASEFAEIAIETMNDNASTK